MRTLLAIAAVPLACLALVVARVDSQTNHVPVDAQSQLMQPRKLTLEQRVRRLERIVADHEKRLTPTPAEANE